MYYNVRTVDWNLHFYKAIKLIKCESKDPKMLNVVYFLLGNNG